MKTQKLMKGAAVLTSLAIFGAAGLGLATTASAAGSDAPGPDGPVWSPSPAAAGQPTPPSDFRRHDGDHRGFDHRESVRQFIQPQYFQPQYIVPQYVQPPLTYEVPLPQTYAYQPAMVSFNDSSVVTATAAILGLPPQYVVSELEQGAPLTTIAASRGWSRDVFVASLVNDLQGNLLNDPNYNADLANLTQVINITVDQPGLQTAQLAIGQGLVWS